MGQYLIYALKGGVYLKSLGYGGNDVADAAASIASKLESFGIDSIDSEEITKAVQDTEKSEHLLKSDPPNEIADYWKRMYPGITTIPKNLEIIPRCSYDVLGHFPLPENAWWEEYYHPLEERINQLRAKYKENPETLRTLNSEQEEIDLYRKYSAWYGSVFYVMQKL